MRIFSHSSLMAYHHCPACWYLKYELKVKSKYEKYNLVFGSIIHKIIEEDPKDIFEAIHVIDRELKNVGEIEKRENKKDIIVKKSEIKADLIKLANIVVNTELELNNTKVEYDEIEKEIIMPYGNNLIRGFLDGISKDRWIIEHKTSKLKYTQEFIEKKHQHNIYEMLYRFYKGEPSKGVLYDVFYKTENPIRDIIPYKIKDSDLQMTKEWMDKMIDGIENKIFTPKKIHNPYFCDYKSICPYCQDKRLFVYD